MKLIKTLGILIGLIAIAQACAIKITPEKTTGMAGEEVKATILIKNQHIPCPLLINSSVISITGTTITNQTEWQKKGAIEYEKSLTVKLTGPDQATITVKRLCNIKTSQSTATIEIKNTRIKPEPKPDELRSEGEAERNQLTALTATLKDSTFQLLNGIGNLYTYRDSLKKLAQSGKYPNEIKKINEIIAHLDSALKYSKKFASQCSLLLKAQ